MTVSVTCTQPAPIIPYQELLGNYDPNVKLWQLKDNYTIPRAIRELWRSGRVYLSKNYYTIPRAIRELWHSSFAAFFCVHYTIPRAIRELWRKSAPSFDWLHYTIPRAIRELWLLTPAMVVVIDYTIPRAIRELWPVLRLLLETAIIPYQELLGNYDREHTARKTQVIIPYQELLGNYDARGARLPQGTDYTIPRAIRELWPAKRRYFASLRLYHTKSY